MGPRRPFGRHDDTTTRRHDVTLVKNPKDVVSSFRRAVVLPRSGSAKRPFAVAACALAGI
jgi:hypothetical protein